MREATIYIPTYRRVDNQVTWRYLSPRWRARAFLVARPEEAGKLRDRGYRVLEAPTKGIAPTRQFILDQHDVDIFGPNLVMMDDDLYFYKRREDDPTKFHSHLTFTDDDFDNMMEDFLSLLDEAPLAGIRNRSGANNHTKPDVLENIRLHDLLGVNMDVVREEGFRIDRVPFMEDFDFILQFLTRGYRNLCLNTYCKGDRGSNAPGGCSTYRDAEGQAAAALRLWELYPNFVRLTKRPGWNGMDETRTDVAVQWKKAYEFGRSTRELL